MYVVESSMMEESSLTLSPQENQTIRKVRTDLEVQTANGIVRSTEETRVQIQNFLSRLGGYPWTPLFLFYIIFSNFFSF